MTSSSDRTKRSKIKRIVVTGGAGFVGSHLCDALLARGTEVIAVDNLATGSKANIKHLLAHPAFTFIKHDIVKPLRISGPVDQIYNLACIASPPQYQKDPIATIKVNTIGVLNILELARTKGARILQTSTSEVYGDPHQHPQTESYRGNVNTIGPRACYDEGKRIAETIFFDYHRRYDVAIRVARLFNTYGPRMSRDDGRVVSNFAVQALAGKPLTVYGTGMQTRSLCYVSDTVAGLIALMDAKDEIGPINIGNPVEMTVLLIAEKIISLTSSKSKIIFKTLPQDDPRQRRPDISLAQKKLSWSPKISLEDGLREVIHFFSLQKK